MRHPPAGFPLQRPSHKGTETSQRREMASKPTKLSRLERSEQTRRILIDAGAAAVGKYGYAASSIARICDRAGIAQGTFYNYFVSRQELFDLLPLHYGELMLDFMRKSMVDGEAGVDREVRRLDSFLKFFEEHQEAATLVNEAPTMAPDGYAEFYRLIRKGYGRAISRSIERGEIRPMAQPQVDALVDLLIAVRSGLSQQLLPALGKDVDRVEHILQWYRGFAENVMFKV